LFLDTRAARLSWVIRTVVILSEGRANDPGPSRGICSSRPRVYAVPEGLRASSPNAFPALKRWAFLCRARGASSCAHVYHGVIPSAVEGPAVCSWSGRVRLCHHARSRGSRRAPGLGLSGWRSEGSALSWGATLFMMERDSRCQRGQIPRPKRPRDDNRDSRASLGAPSAVRSGV
jgi:hypothetical protein